MWDIFQENPRARWKKMDSVEVKETGQKLILVESG